MGFSKKINFASENYAGVHDNMMQALVKCNTGNQPSYANDEVTSQTIEVLKEVLGQNIEVHFTFNGTGANNFGLSGILQKHQSVFCTDVAHIFVDESNAPEAFLGCRLYPVNSVNGKMNFENLKNKVKRFGDVHHPQPKVVSLTQPTEYGTVYTIDELKAIKSFCTENGMLLHVDGARFYNAAVYLNKSLQEICQEAGIDVLTLGGTKIGMMFGEAVIFFNPASNNYNRFNLKRSMQLASKNRFIAIQFHELLKENLWKQMATYTNQLAKEFESGIRAIPGLTITRPVETNAVFIKMPNLLMEKMQDFFSFYCWNETESEARFVLSFNNTIEEVGYFIDKLKELLKS